MFLLKINYSIVVYIFFPVSLLTVAVAVVLVVFIVSFVFIKVVSVELGTTFDDNYPFYLSGLFME